MEKLVHLLFWQKLTSNFLYPLIIRIKNLESTIYLSHKNVDYLRKNTVIPLNSSFAFSLFFFYTLCLPITWTLSFSLFLSIFIKTSNLTLFTFLAPISFKPRRHLAYYTFTLTCLLHLSDEAVCINCVLHLLLSANV